MLHEGESEGGPIRLRGTEGNDAAKDLFAEKLHGVSTEAMPQLLLGGEVALEYSQRMFLGYMFPVPDAKSYGIPPRLGEHPELPTIIPPGTINTP